jgi:hypothetical protein
MLMMILKLSAKFLSLSSLSPAFPWATLVDVRSAPPSLEVTRAGPGRSWLAMAV